MRPIGEFELIALFTREAPAAGAGVVAGIGDDAAVLRPPPGELLVSTVDAVVDRVHFGRAFAPEDVGWKALAVNLSDVAAMGARPLWALVALATPRREDPSRLARIGRGLASCARAHRVAVVGGNVTRASELSLTVTVLGSARPGRILRRSGARAEDALLVSGTLGDAALGLLPGAAPALARRQRRPTPRLALGRALAGIAHACIDVSDGLLQDLGHLCRASGVGASLRLSELPLSPAYLRVARGLADPFEPALSGGEDYELLAAVPVRRVPEALRAGRRARTPLTVVGSVVPGRRIQVARCEGGLHPVRRLGHDHLAVPRRRSLTWTKEDVGSILP